MRKIDFKVGDVVQLNSGGPKMTITYISEILEETAAMCEWYGNNGIQADKFPVECIKLWKDNNGIN